MKKIISALLCLFTALSGLSSCGFEEANECNIFAMDTVITIRAFGDGNTAKTVFSECENEISELEKKLSRTDKESDCSAFNSLPEGNADGDFLTVLSLALEIANDTDGAYDPTVAPLTELWKINDADAVGIPTDAEITEILGAVGYRKITLSDSGKFEKQDARVAVDLGGIGKGYAAELVMKKLAESDLDYGTVSFGGNVAVFGKKPNGENFAVSIRDPRDTSGTVGKISMKSGIVSVSGSYERYREADGKIYHHIFDTSTGYPAESGLLSVAVISESGGEADALSTALFVMGADKGYEFYRSGKRDFEAIFITDDGRILLTDGIFGSFTLTNPNYRTEKLGEGK